MSKSLEYWAAPASDKYNASLDAAKALGSLHAQMGQKPNAKGIYGLARNFYFMGYRNPAPVQFASAL